MRFIFSGKTLKDLLMSKSMELGSIIKNEKSNKER
jgi:hypothetical protein